MIDDWGRRPRRGGTGCRFHAAGRGSRRRRRSSQLGGRGASGPRRSRGSTPAGLWRSTTLRRSRGGSGIGCTFRRPLSRTFSSFRGARKKHVPLPLLDVARICRKNRVWRGAKIAISSIVTRSKKNLARGVFWVLRCCTNSAIPTTDQGFNRRGRGGTRSRELNSTFEGILSHKATEPQRSESWFLRAFVSLCEAAPAGAEKPGLGGVLLPPAW